MFLTRDALRAAAESDTPKITYVDAPALGGRVGILHLRQHQIDEMHAWAKRVDRAEKRRITPRKILYRWVVLVRTLVNDQGDRILSDEDVREPWLDALPSALVMGLFAKAMQLNGLSDTALAGDTDDDEAGAGEPATAPAASA